ncbi:MAG: hypothetical protein WCK82_14860 [Bacteroidota bacterium]|jgi:hypothetical protein
MRSEKIDEAIQEVKNISFSKNNFVRIKKMLLEIENSNGAILFLLKRKIFKIKERKTYYNKLEREIIVLKKDKEAYQKEENYILREQNNNLCLQIQNLKKEKNLDIFDELSIDEKRTIQNLIFLLKKKHKITY